MMRLRCGSGAHRAAGPRRWSAFALLALLLWSVVYPNAAIIVGSFERGLGDWRDFAASPADRDALWGTVVVSIGSVIGALLIGVPLAFLLSRTEFRGRRILSGVATLPAALPPLVGVLAFLFLYGESGVDHARRAARARARGRAVDADRGSRP